MMKQNVPLCLLDTEITGPKKEEGKKSANQALCVDPTLVSFFFFFSCSCCWVENLKCPIFVNKITKLIKI